ncbi:hypothetical protein NQ317_011094 [Molorchus minor]|uniref:tRNA-5-taurinomethyluridine 2-sulfurtransferase n=1 Tax=Molorchus minor TaxID=1323400 RepID=A0ABQ9K3U1_9CUCU|nr:hypothetical protein NQ317_011094 [Molorchus minor]
MYHAMKKVALGVSGGVDSAVAALLLKGHGFDVEGVFMQNWDIADEKGVCSADEDYKDAQLVCQNHLIKEYESGYTPNPDIICNRNIKFNYFYKYAINELKADAIATGHYAKTNFGPYLEFYQPNKVWEFVFIGSRNFQNFIEEYIPNKPGNFVNVDNAEIVGHHKGIHQWTVGQRARVQGLPEAFFTARKDVQTNTIYVAQGTKHPILHTTLFFTSPAHWFFECEFKFQHTEAWVPCEICDTTRGLVVKLHKSKRAITPGQYAVFSKDNECLGSAKIMNSGVTNFSLYYLKHMGMKDIDSSGILNMNDKKMKIINT